MITHGIFIMLGGTSNLFTYVLLVGLGIVITILGRYLDRKYGEKFYRELEDEINKQ